MLCVSTGNQFNRPVISCQSQSRKTPPACLSSKRMPTVRLALADVGNVYFHDRYANGTDAVGQGDGSVGIGSWIHHHGIVLSVSLLQLVDEATFVVRLVIGKFMLWKFCFQLQQVFLKRNMAIDFWLTFAEHVQVGTVDDEDFHLWNFFAKIVFLDVPIDFFVGKVGAYQKIFISLSPKDIGHENHHIREDQPEGQQERFRCVTDTKSQRERGSLFVA